MTNLVDHARRELAAINEDPEISKGLLKVIQAYADMKLHAETTAETIQTLNALLEFQHLTDLTDDPEEWYQHEMLDGTFWQNKRNGGAFSRDGGKTYYLTEEGANQANPFPVHVSRSRAEVLLGAETHG